MSDVNQAGVAFVSPFIAKAASAAEKGGAVITLGAATKQYFGFTLDEWSLIGIFIGIGLGVLGYLTNVAMSWYFRSQHLKLAIKTHRPLEDE